MKANAPNISPSLFVILSEASNVLRLPRLRTGTPNRQKVFSIDDHFGVQARASPSQ
jgi:hypothetical protein